MGRKIDRDPGGLGRICIPRVFVYFFNGLGGVREGMTAVPRIGPDARRKESA
jgi:hypothetical protein